MLIYNKTKKDFCDDVFTNDIAQIVLNSIIEKTGHGVWKNELNSFQNSLWYMERVVNDPEIPDTAWVSIEYHIPWTSKRVDFIITGKDGNKENVIIVELKQWQQAKLTDRDWIVNTRFQHWEHDTSHPSYQAWSYASLLESFNDTVDQEDINLYPCAYLHNYEPDDVITNDFYSYYTEKAPAFLKPDALKLRNFIKKYIKEWDTSNIMFKIDNGKIKPTKWLADVLDSMMNGNKEFTLIDDQKVVYETALKLALESTEKNKNVLIVEGWPWTWKSVVAINLLIELNKLWKLTQYTTKTSAPREVFIEKLKNGRKLWRLRALFPWSGSFIDTPKNAIHALIVDEAHRLTEKTGFLRRWENQIQEIMDASLFSIFFIDESQRVHVDDYGSIDEISKIAQWIWTKVHKMDLQSQFRCNGSDWYLAWIDNTLQIRETANYNLDDLDFKFDFKVFDNPKELRDIIFEKNKINNRARLVAWYCRPWDSKNDKTAYDFKEEDFGFNMRWNMTDYWGKWVIDPNSVTEIWCIHTAQWLELDYIWVIIWDDLVVRNGEVLVNPAARDKWDRTIFWWKSWIKKDPNYWKDLLKDIIKNTYRTLMTRWMKWCYIYCTDKETADYFKSKIWN